MNKKVEIDRITVLLSRWVAEIRLNTKLDFYDINKISEGLCAKLLNAVFNYKLEDLNKVARNFPGVDLGDEENKIAFQVTSRTDFQKFKDNIDTFVKKDANNKSLADVFVNGIRFFVITIEEIKSGKIDLNAIYSKFDFKKDIIRIEELLWLISAIYDNDINQFLKIKDILELEFGDNALKPKDNKNEYIPTLSFTFNNSFQLTNPIDEIEILLEEVQLRMNSDNQNILGIVIEEEKQLIEQLLILKTQDNNLNVRKQIIEIEKIIQYLGNCKTEINFKIRLLLELYAFNVSKIYSSLAISLVEISKLLYNPIITVEETAIIDRLNISCATPKNYNVKETKFDVWNRNNEPRIIFAIYMNDSEISNLQQKSSIKEKSKDEFLLNLSIQDFEVFDLELQTVYEKVIPKFVAKVYDNQDWLKSENLEDILDLFSYKIGLG